MITRAYHAARGELAQRDEIVTTIQAHPCNAATAAAAGFKVVTLPLEEDGYPSLDALKAAVSERTAALMVNNPDDMGIYNPQIDTWVEVVHEAGGLCFYDHANFNGVMGKLRARELGFDACMYMLHKTFGAPKGGGGPAVGAYGCTEELAPFLPAPVVVQRRRPLPARPTTGPRVVGKVREFWGNVPQLVKAYAWSRAMGADGIDEASDLSVLANNYMEQRLLAIRGVTKSHPHLDGAAAGDDALQPRARSSRRPASRSSTSRTGWSTSASTPSGSATSRGSCPSRSRPRPARCGRRRTSTSGSTCSRTSIDEAYTDPELVRTAPHNQAIRQLDATDLDDPANWATTWRAYRRKRPGSENAASGAATEDYAKAAT